MSYHQFANETEQFGSFETFFTCGSVDQESEESIQPGWYWQAGFPGCIPDGEPMGPFENEQEAIEDATDLPQRLSTSFILRLQNLFT